MRVISERVGISVVRVGTIVRKYAYKNLALHSEVVSIRLLCTLEVARAIEVRLLTIEL